LLANNVYGWCKSDLTTSAPAQP